jgi:hypothetical protein
MKFYLWTRTRPSKPGIYWYFDGLCDNPTIMYVEYFRKSNPLNDQLGAQLYADNGCSISFQFIAGEKGDPGERWMHEPTIPPDVPSIPESEYEEV